MTFCDICVKTKHGAGHEATSAAVRFPNINKRETMSVNMNTSTTDSGGFATELLEQSRNVLYNMPNISGQTDIPTTMRGEYINSAQSSVPHEVYTRSTNANMQTHMYPNYSQQYEEPQALPPSAPPSVLPPPPTTQAPVNMNLGNGINGGINGGPQFWMANILSNLNIRLQHIETQLANQNNNWQNIETAIATQSSTLQNQNSRMVDIETQINEVPKMKQSMHFMENSMKMLDSRVKATHAKLSQFESSVQSYSDMCEGISSEKIESDSALNDLYRRVEDLEIENKTLRDKQEKSEQIIIDLQCRSMRDNLLFTGISEPELNEDEYENVEDTLNYFLRSEMHIEQPIPFHRVHRLGQTRPEDGTPRHIVAKFEKFKDRELVRTAAPTKLRDTEFGVREQFPKSVELKRRKLYPEMKRARQNPQNKIRLVRDKLYVNDQEYIPDDDTPDYEPRNNQGGYRSGTGSRSNFGTRIFRRGQRAQRQESRIHEYAKSKSSVYRRSNRENAESLPPMMQTPRPNSNRSVNFSIPYRSESNATDLFGQRGTPGAGKHPASSPADGDQTVKKHREGSDESSSEDSDLEVITHRSPQSDPPNDSNSAKTVQPPQTIELNNHGNGNEAQTTTGCSYLNAATLNIGPTKQTIRPIEQTPTHDNSDA